MLQAESSLLLLIVLALVVRALLWLARRGGLRVDELGNAPLCGACPQRGTGIDEGSLNRL